MSVNISLLSLDNIARTRSNRLKHAKTSEPLMQKGESLQQQDRRRTPGERYRYTH